MEQAFIEQQKASLDTLHREYQETLKQLKTERAQGFADTEVKQREEMVDIDTQHKTEIAEINLLQQRIEDVDQALQAIAYGSYGICDRCGKPIPPERLEASPMARYCLPCQEIVDAA